uniref:Mediator of RNA polymerase II transcription subunit 18 n=1 Tax=Cyprinus carpio TaxID=7962 RepID=A0A8C2I7A7_CYPCA
MLFCVYYSEYCTGWRCFVVNILLSLQVFCCVCSSTVLLKFGFNVISLQFNVLKDLKSSEELRHREMEAPPVTVMPVTGGTINMMEYLLQGSVLDQSMESLLHRLRGLCDNMEPESFADHELVYLLKGQQGNPFMLRARRSLLHPTAPWHLRYLGQPEVGDKSRHALVRNCVDVAASHSLPEFLNEMGFRMDHEFVAKGQVFRKGAMKVVVSKLLRVLATGNTENTEPLSLSYLVELSVLAPAGQDNVSEDMRSFAEQLKPLVHLEKIDPKRLM